MLKIKEAILVEGKYDKNKLSGVADTLILTTDGFGIFKDAEKRALLRRLAASRGLIILTDGDGAGFLIRNHLKGVLPADGVKHAYIPDMYGKERRKDSPSREGKLGVEGMSREVLERALRQAGATVLDGGPALDGEISARTPEKPLTKAGLYALGLSGGPESARKRRALLKRLGLPENMTANAMVAAVNMLYTAAEWRAFMFSFTFDDI